MQKYEDAVSPVVGVMLMLIVTIIIAAIVAAFAGGSLGTTEKAPVATIQATYSQTTGMTITHNGGDAIPLGTTKILVKPSRTFGDDASRYSWVVNKSYVYTNGTSWASARAFIPGDTASITAANLSYIQQRPDMTTNDASNATYGFDNTVNVGLSFDLLFVDSSGNTIGKTSVTIGR
ncbi:MAG: type IV pilin N-terminal domain-containing protein [Methanoregula sp.]|nr:type IV pilin N-terminal domain-containing protein [Methanoregula sp.]